MSSYWLSFDLHSDSSYQQRYNALMAEATRRGMHWKDTTSFVIFSASDDIDVVMNDLANTVDGRKDLLLLRKMDSKDARVYGKLRDGDIFTLMPYLRETVDA